MNIEHAAGFGEGLKLIDDMGNSINVEYKDLTRALINFEMKNKLLKPDEMFEYLMREFPDWKPDIINNIRFNLLSEIDRFVDELDFENISKTTLVMEIEDFIGNKFY